MGFAAFSAMPERFAGKINLFVAFSPVAFVGHQRSPLLTKLAYWKTEKLFSYFGFRGFMTSMSYANLVFPGIVKHFPGEINAVLMRVILDGITGWSDDNFDVRSFSLLCRHQPGGTSMQDISHWAQCARTGEFKMFDFGAKLNERVYGSEIPPHYDLRRMTVPVAIWHGGRDHLCQAPDVDRLFAELPTLIFHKYIERYSHMDPVWGKDAHLVVYPSLLRLLWNSVSGVRDKRMAEQVQQLDEKLQHEAPHVQAEAREGCLPTPPERSNLVA